MKRFIIVLILGLVLIPAVGLAINLGIDSTSELNKAVKSSGYSTNTDETTFASLLGTVVKGVLSFAGVVFLILMVYAGYLWMTARGEEGQVDKAHDIIRAAVIGLIITVGAYSITSFVVPRIVEKTTRGAPTVGAQVQCCLRANVTSLGIGMVQFTRVNSQQECMGANNTGINEGLCSQGGSCTYVTSLMADQCQGTRDTN